MNSITLNALCAFGNLLWRDLRAFKAKIINCTVDSLMWTGTTVIVDGYLMPLLGINHSYGSFMLVGATISMCLFHTINRGCEIVMDFENTKSINYDLILPFPSWMALLKIALVFAIEAALINLLSLPIGKLLLFNNFDLSNFSIIKWPLMFIAINLFFGFFGLWVASWVKNSSSYPHVWMRFVLPLWNFGGFHFSWFTLKNAYPLFGYINLLNPMVYAFEGLRAVVLGQPQFINAYACIIALIIFTALLWTHTLYLLKRRLDFV